MNIQNIRALRGPNYWSSTHHRLIVVSLKQAPSSPPTSPAPDAVIAADVLSRLGEHLDTETQKGLKALSQDAPDFLHLVAPLALALQAKAGMEASFSAVKSDPERNEHSAVFGYLDEEAGKQAGRAALDLLKALVAGLPFNLEETLATLTYIWEGARLGPSTGSVVAEAVQRDIPCIRLDDSFFQLGYGSKQKRIEATIASTTSSIAVDKASDKHRTKQLLESAFIPVPEGIVLQNEQALEDAIEEVGFPIVIKPLDGNQGKGATINIKSMNEAVEAFHRAKAYSRRVIVERFVEGADFRALVINYKFVAAAKRTPAAVKGDGIHTVAELVAITNRDPRRGAGHGNVLTAITIDEGSLELLSHKGYTPDTVLAAGEEVYLKWTANLSTGGTAKDVTDSVHPCNVSLFERIARTMDLDICGIDVMAPDLQTPIAENGGAVIEVNAAPGFRMHLEPTTGKGRNVAAPLIDMLFPYGDNGRIPIVAVSGTNGKTTTTRLIAQMASQSGFTTGFTTTDGIYIDKQRIYKGDCSGPASAGVVLKDKSTEFAVLECARGGILRSGLAYDQCDCAVITNVAEDHLGLGGIHTLNELARVKGVVAKSVAPTGWVVLNADDDHVYAMREEVRGKVALFSMYEDNPRIMDHCERGGIAAYPSDGFIILREHNHIRPIDEIENIPITYGGKAGFNVMNVLGAVLAAYVTRLALPAIRTTLRNFKSSPEHTPGRLNFFEFDNFTVLLDYAHNTHGVKAVGEFIRTLPATKKIGVITAVGDRRNEDIIALGEAAAPLFDKLVVRQDDDLRGRTAFELWSLLEEGVRKSAPDGKIVYSYSEAEAVDKAIELATPGSLVVFLVDNVDAITKKITERRDQRTRKLEELRIAI